MVVVLASGGVLDGMFISASVRAALGLDSASHEADKQVLSGEELLAALSRRPGEAVDAHVVLRGKAQSESVLRQLPAGLRLRGSLVVASAPAARLAFPAGLCVDATLLVALHGEQHAAAELALGEGLRVGGDLVLAGCSALTRLPEDVYVGGDLELGGCSRLTALPEALRVGGSVDLYRCTLLASLPPLDVPGAVDLEDCTALTALPEGLHVGDDLDLTGCTSLTVFPASVRVGGVLDLDSCSGLQQRLDDDEEEEEGGMDAFLTQLRAVLRPGSGLRLRHWTAIRELPACLASMDGVLDLLGCTSLTRLPEGLCVGATLRLDLCSALTALPDGLSVGTDLNLGRCTALASLPAGLSVGSDLFLGGCSRIASLPEDLAVGGNLYLHHCTALESLPASLLEWPLREDSRRPHVIYAAGSGLSQAALEWLREAEAPGLRFAVGLGHDDGERPRPGFASVREAVEFWAQEAGGTAATTASAKTPEGDGLTLTRFLSRLRDAKEFGIAETRKALAKRVVAVLELLSGDDEHVREELLLRMSDSLDACGDKPVWALNQMHLVVEVAKARESAEQLRDLGRRVMRLMVVHEHAKRKVDSLRWVDDVCVYLRFEIDLREALDLPVAATAMIYPSYIKIEDAELEAAKEDALAITDAQFEAWLAEWPEWQRQQRHQVVAKLSWQELAEIKRRQSLRKRVSQRLSRLVSVVGDKVVDPVTLDDGKSVWSLSDLLKHWERTGLDLHNAPVSVEQLCSNLKRVVA